MKALSVDGRRLSVSLYVRDSPVPDHKSRIQENSKLKTDSNEVHDTDDPCTPLEVERSKVKVSRPINAETENAPHLPNGETDELQTWYRDVSR